MIVAMDQNRLIGRDNLLPWKIPEDLAYFRAQTLDKNVIMGKQTWLSLGKVLDRRTNIVLSRDKSLDIAGGIVCNSVEAVFETIGDEHSFVIGGAQIFAVFLPYISRLYITQIDASFTGDTYFPTLDLSSWRQIYYESMDSSAGYRISLNEYHFGIQDTPH